MSSVTISSITFAFAFGGAMLGMLLRTVLPDHHMNSDSKDAVKVAMALVSTMSALALGMLIASAKSSYDTQKNELTDMSSKVIMLDRVLAHYGPESKEARDQLRNSVRGAIDQMWSKDRTGLSQTAPSSASSEDLYDKILALSPETDAQRSIQSQALSIVISLGQIRWLMYEQRAGSGSAPLMSVLVFWLTALFISFGLFAPRNATVFATLLISAISASFAILLILDMSTPYAGLIRLSDAPLRAAFAHLGQ
ncbi:MAG TPA: hypothetical protein VIX91_08635 [Candidatus Acidoferrum sp.]